jgi:hypothetical protein
MKCPQCQQVLPADYPAKYCPYCGDDFPKDFPIEQTSLRAPEKAPSKKWKYWLVYWLVSFGSPLLALCERNEIELLGCLLVGWFVCGWALQKIFLGKLRRQILFAMLVPVVYAATIFLRLLYALGHMH